MAILDIPPWFAQYSSTVMLNSSSRVSEYIMNSDERTVARLSCRRECEKDRRTYSAAQRETHLWQEEELECAAVQWEGIRERRPGDRARHAAQSAVQCEGIRERKRDCRSSESAEQGETRLIIARRRAMSFPRYTCTCIRGCT